VPDALHDLAKDLLERATELQLQGELELAADLYQRSIETWPTAEAYTCLGWAYRYQGRIEDAIEECKKAIVLDPSLGTPYNDIGGYLIELGRPDEAIPWLEKAIASERYDSYHFPWYNLGRVYLAKEMFNRAREYFEKSLEIDSEYEPAAEALVRIRHLLQ
jgi:Tfp pilus assembly protein PilF